MDISEWLDRKEAEGVDASRIDPPEDLLYDASPDEVVFFQVVNPCSILCSKEHPFSTVERLRALVLLQGPGQESRHSRDGDGVAVFYEKQRPRHQNSQITH